MTSIMDRIRCALCECVMDDVDVDEEPRSMFRIRPRWHHPFFLCEDCLTLPPEGYIRDLVQA